MISDSLSDEDSDDECPKNQKVIPMKITIVQYSEQQCLIMNRSVRHEPSGTEEITEILKLSTRKILIRKTLTLCWLQQTY